MTTQVTLPSALVTCTRNRSQRLDELLAVLESTSQVPRIVVVVDSSDNDDAFEVTKLHQDKAAYELVFVKSDYGAAHQKNVGFDYVTSRFLPTELQVIHFLDDDIVPSPNYFADCIALFLDSPDAIVIGGFDQNLEPIRPSRVRDLFLLSRGAESGITLKSGICVVPRPVMRLQPVEWVPGGMQNFSFPRAYEQRFDGRVRIYGDEVEIQLRLGQLGKIYSSNLLAVSHHSETIAKDSNRIEQSYMDGFRWALTRKYPGKYKPWAVLYATLALGLGELIRSIQKRDRLAFTRFQGHADFLFRLIRREAIQQYVSHAGSGPLVGENRY